MKIYLYLLIMFFCSICCLNSISGQQLTDQEKQKILFDLTRTDSSYSYMAINNVMKFELREAEPIIISNIWKQPVLEQSLFLRCLFFMKSEQTLELFNQFYNKIDQLDFSGQVLNALFYKGTLNYYLFQLGSFDKRNFLYEYLHSNSASVSRQDVFSLELLFQNYPNDREIVIRELSSISVNSTQANLRYYILSRLHDFIGEEIIPFAMQRMANETEAANKDLILWNILNKHRNNVIRDFIKDRIGTDTSSVLNSDILRVLLKTYGTPNDLNFTLKKFPIITDTTEASFFKITYLDNYIVPANPNFTTNSMIDSLHSYNSQCASYNWLGSGTFSDQIKTYLTEAKTKLAGGDSLGAALKIKLYQNQIAEQFKDTVTTDGKFVTEDGYKFLYYYPKYILERLPKLPTVKFNNSQGNLINTGSLQYYEGGWKDAVNNNDGTFTVPTALKTISLKMNYAYGSQQKSNVTVSTDTIVFQTVNAQVKLLDSKEAILDTGRVQYYSNGWRDFGITANGAVRKELLPGTYTFKMNYAFASIDKQQNIETNPVVEFHTKAVNVKLNNSLGNPLDVGTVQYYSNGWRNFGLTTNGVAVKELLPVNYTFKMNYGFATIDKQQNVSTNPVVEFSTALVNVKLNNSLGEPLDVGTVQYYSNGWRDFGTTVNGIAEKELLPVNYTFRMNFGFASVDKQQNLSQNNGVVFQTVNALVQLKDSQGNPLDAGTVEYYSNGWRSFGTTENGNAQKELLPASYTFRMTHAFVSNDKVQVIGTNNTITFSTTLCSVNVKDAQNQPVNNASVSYYSNGWRAIGTTVNGLITKELLPANLTFRAVSGSKQLDKTQNIGTNNNVEINLP